MKKDFDKHFPNKEMKVLSIGQGAKEILMRNCLDKIIIEKAIDKVKDYLFKGEE